MSTLLTLKRTITQKIFSTRYIHMSPIRVDFYETKEEYHLDADLPGVKKEDVKVSLNEGVITIEAAKSPRLLEKSDAATSDVLAFHKSERGSGTATRMLRLPADADTAFLKAKLRDGVLSIFMPRLEHSPSSAIAVEVEEEA